MSTNSGAGSTIAISAVAPTTFDTTGYAALTFTEIGEVTNIGNFGRTYAKVEHKPLKTRATQKRKGSYDPGTIDLAMARDKADAGQTLLKTASQSDANYSFKVTRQNGDIVYFQGQVFGFNETIGGVDDMNTVASTIEVNAAGTTGVDFVRADAA